MSYYCCLVYFIDIIFRTIQGYFFIVLRYVKMFVWYLFESTQYSYYLDLFFLVTASRLRECHCHGWVRYIDTTMITVLMFVWYRLVFTPYSYYRNFFCLGAASCLRNFHPRVWVRYIDNKNFTVACMSSLLFSIDIWRYWYFIMFYFKWPMVQWRNSGWINGVMDK